MMQIHLSVLLRHRKSRKKRYDPSSRANTKKQKSVCLSHHNKRFLGMNPLRPVTWKISPSPKQKKYDFIVVGGGSGGCTVASRLSEDSSVSVLLLEAGGNGLVLDARIPAAAGKLQHTDLDWNDYCEPQENRACTKLIDGKSFWPRGKCLGGSSVINYM